jgi:hypothetical protein
MKHYCRTGTGIMADLWRGFWILETGTGQQVAQLHDRYMMMMVFFLSETENLILRSADRACWYNSCKKSTWGTVLVSICLFQFSTCVERPRAHHQEIQLCQYNIWYVSLCVGDRLVCRSGRNQLYEYNICYVSLWPSSMQVGKFLPDLHTGRSPTQWHIPDVVLIQLILLMMSTSLLEKCRKLK